MIFYDINTITFNDIIIDGDKHYDKKKRICRVYFGILNNHVKSTSLRAREFKAHLLNWLIYTFTDEKESVLMLQDKISEDTMMKMERTPTNSIKIGCSPITSKIKKTRQQPPDKNVDDICRNVLKKHCETVTLMGFTPTHLSL